VRVQRMAAVLPVMALPGCAVAVVTGGAIVADEVVGQVEGGGDGLSFGPRRGGRGRRGEPRPTAKPGR
jgi:hypothetical protein